MKRTLFNLLLLLSPLFAHTAFAQGEPHFRFFKFDDGAIINSMSDNGLWAAADGTNAANSLFRTGPRLINIETEESTLLTTAYDEAEIISAAANDVNNDGTIVVGELNERPAYWSKATGRYTLLSTGTEADGGVAFSITADGRYAVGKLTYTSDLYKETQALWDITTGELIATPGIPTKDMAHEDKGQNRFVSISADGRYILGCMSFSYLPMAEYAGGICYYVYDTETDSYSMVGFEDDPVFSWEAKADNISHISTARLSNNGLWITGSAHIIKEVEGSQFGTEYDAPYLMNVATGEFTLFDATEDADKGGWTVDNVGNVMGASPISNPYRDWSVRSGLYWFDIDQILKQKYGIDYKAKTGYDNTGTPMTIADNGCRIAIMADIEGSYVLEIPETFASTCTDIDLLGQYTVSPTTGAALSKLQKIKVNFGRYVKVLGAANSVEIRDAEGATVYTSVGLSAESHSKTVNITFRKGALEAGKAYTLHIPAGSICIEGDETRTNRAIDIDYMGRADIPVQLTNAYPADNATFAQIDYAANPIILTFDTEVMIAEAVQADLYRTGENEACAKLLMSYGGKQVAVYPATTEYLYKDVEYKVVIPAGVITDLAGNNANNEIVLNYVGAYEREISFDDKTLFYDDFDNGLMNFMFYEGDGRTPNSTMQSWGFADATNYPWSLVRDNTSSTDMSACSHSCYEPAGKSDDWMVMPQVFIPDNLCVLKFQGQSYKKTATDMLRIIVWENNSVYNALNTSIVEKMRSEGTTIFHEQLQPGATEDGLDGEWSEYSVDLRQFAGKNIYIAFINENEAQSALMINNVEVTHNIPFLVTLDNASSVVNKDNLIIKGRITIDTEAETYSSVQLVLKNAAGIVVSRLSAENLNLKKGDVYAFEFTEALPLEKGKSNAYSIDVRLNNTENTINAAVKNLQFQPVKRVVLEEMTGQGCVNCPLGKLAIEKISNTFGNQFIPIALHTYTGDNLGAGLEAYNSFLGLNAAPSGIINRSGFIAAPMMSIDGDYVFNGVNGEKLWLDLVQEELAVPADAEISATASFNTDSTAIVIPCSVKFALEAEKQNLNLFAVILEDNVKGYQRNTFGGISDADLGEWGEGGSLSAGTTYPFYHNHVARATIGQTFNGTGGYIPANVVAGKEYSAGITATLPANATDLSRLHVVVMMIDANTGRVINATQCAVKAYDPVGIHHTAGETPIVRVSGDEITVQTSEQAQVQIYTGGGTLLAGTTGKGTLTLPTRGYKGMVVAKVSTVSGCFTKKLLLN